MTDRELLELAAKAAGISYDKTTTEHDYKFGLWLIIAGEPNEFTRRSWNPLTDDGDALRLAVKLGFCVSQWPRHTSPDVMVGYLKNVDT